MRLIDADALRENMKFVCMGVMAGTEPYAAPLTEIDNAPTIEPEQRWIPVSERLPDDGRQVLVYATSVHYALAKYDEMREADGTYKKQWATFDAWKPFYKIKNVLAWMPLPEPYKEKDNEKA